MKKLCDSISEAFEMVRYDSITGRFGKPLMGKYENDIHSDKKKANWGSD